MAEQFSHALTGIGTGMLGIAVTIVLAECVVWCLRRTGTLARTEQPSAAEECCELCGRCPISPAS